MKKKNHKPNGTLFSPELRAVIGKLKRKEPELDVLTTADQTTDQQNTSTPHQRQRRDRIGTHPPG
jgi:hypothetical protein